MTIPQQEYAVPDEVLDLVRGRPTRTVWQNQLGGLTFRISDAGGDEYLKWAPSHPEIDLGLEAEKLAWSGTWVAVPRVLSVGHSATGAAWLHTRGIAGDSAVSPRWVADPVTAARAIGSGLRHLHDTLPVRDCPWAWDLTERLPMIKQESDLVLVDEAPPEDRLVVCHGDACAPNTLLATDGTCVGHVDLGELGVGDRWADLAVATYSLGWNYPGDHERDLLEAYGIDPDPERMSFYRRLWDAT
ncbi:MAG: phosphotransferase [Propionibacteriaceae bacterium]